MLSSILLAAPLQGVAQEKSKQEKKENFWNLFSFKGFGFSTDLFGCAYSLIGEGISTEIADRKSVV